MSDNAIVQIPEGQMSKFDDSVFVDLSKSGDWFPRIQLFSAKTKEVGAGRIAMNHYGIVVGKDNIRDLGTEVNVIPCGWRPCAVRIGSDTVDNYFDQNSPEFKQVQAESEISDSGCFFGLQFLLYVPSVKMFGTFLFGTKSARPEAGNMRPLIGKMATLKSRIAANKKYQWQVPVVTECSEEPVAVPDPEDLAAKIDKFNNPPAPIVKEKAEGVADSGREQ